VRRDVTEQPDVDDAMRAIAVVAGAPRGDGERGVLDLEGEAPRVGEDDQHIRHLSVVHRFVIDLDARLGKGTVDPITNQVLAAQVVPALGRVGDGVEGATVGEVIAPSAAPSDQTRIGAAGKRAYQIASMTIST
jgi:hypothetical protein